MLVQMRGLEPPRPCEHQHLKLACLPIPPHLHGYPKFHRMSNLKTEETILMLCFIR